jgi:hypothetical protein
MAKTRQLNMNPSEKYEAAIAELKRLRQKSPCPWCGGEIGHYGWCQGTALLTDLEKNEPAKEAEPKTDQNYDLFSNIRNPEKVKKLLAAGADVNTKSPDHIESTPLHDAAYNGQAETVKLLLESGADVNAKSAHGRTPLHWAVRGYGPYYPLVELLLKAGADVNVVDYRGYTAQDYAFARDSETFKLLKETGGKTAEELKPKAEDEKVENKPTAEEKPRALESRVEALEKLLVKKPATKKPAKNPSKKS